MKFSKYLSMLFLFAFSMITAQNIEIKGKVTENANGQPLPGASVIVKNTSKGATTDLDGNYVIKASSNDILVFSFVGYESKEITVGTESTINITLIEENKTLEEVVVIGYGTQKRKNLTSIVLFICAKNGGLYI